MKGMNEMTEPWSAQAVGCVLEAEVSPLLSPAMARLYRHPLLLRLAVTIEPADWSGTAHGEDTLCKHGW